MYCGCVNICMIECVLKLKNARVRKHNLRSSRNKMNVIVRDVWSFSNGTYTIS